MASKLIVIVGSGPGMGVATGSRFASKGFNVAVLSRDAQRLQQDVASIQKSNANVKVQAYPVDVGDHVALPKVLAKVQADLGEPEVVYFNAARVAPTTIGETTSEEILEDFKSMNIGFYVTASWAVPLLSAAAGRPDAHPSFLFTNSPLWDRPISAFFSLSMQKAAQYNLALSLKQILASKGVHVASVNIEGLINVDDPVLNPTAIADNLYKLYEQDQSDWQWEICLGNWDEFLKKMSGQ